MGGSRPRSPSRSLSVIENAVPRLNHGSWRMSGPRLWSTTGRWHSAVVNPRACRRRRRWRVSDRRRLREMSAAFAIPARARRLVLVEWRACSDQWEGGGISVVVAFWLCDARWGWNYSPVWLKTTRRSAPDWRRHRGDDPDLPAYERGFLTRNDFSLRLAATS